MKNKYRANKGEEYWFIADSGDIDYTIEQNNYKDNFRYKVGNYFKTVYEADKFLTKLENKGDVKNVN